MRKKWIVNNDMNDDNGNPTQWIYKNGIIDLFTNGLYGVGIYYEDGCMGDWYYFDIQFKTLDEAMNFAEYVWR